MNSSTFGKRRVYPAILFDMVDVCIQLAHFLLASMIETTMCPGSFPKNQQWFHFGFLGLLVFSCEISDMFSSWLMMWKVSFYHNLPNVRPIFWGYIPFIYPSRPGERQAERRDLRLRSRARDLGSSWSWGKLRSMGAAQ